MSAGLEAKHLESYGIVMTLPDRLHMKNYFPNELGRVRVSVKDMSVIPIEVESIGDIMTEENDSCSKKSNRKSSKQSKRQSIQESASHSNDPSDARHAIDDIWKHMGLGHTDISYACVGYSMDGRPILNYDEFINLLVNYGFNVDVVIKFIDDFVKNGVKDSKSPIVMFTTNTSAIMTDIQPIV